MKQFNRFLINKLALYIIYILSIVCIFTLFFIIGIICYKGLPSLNISLFLLDGLPPLVDNGGGLRHAIVGQTILVFLSMLIAIPIGILSATYTNEFDRKSKLSNIIRLSSNTLASVPTIIIGIFIYSIMVLPTKHFSALAGSIALAIIIIPIIANSVENALRMVPNTLREASMGLGAAKWKVTLDIVYSSAKPAILSALILAVGRVSGEVAPLLFTSLGNNELSINIDKPIASLTLLIYEYSSAPYNTWINIGWAATFIVTISILFINLLAKLYINKQKYRRKK